MNKPGSNQTGSIKSGPGRTAPLALLILLLLVLASLPKVLAEDQNQAASDKPPEPAVTQPRSPQTGAPSAVNAEQGPPVTPAAVEPVTAAEPVEEFIPSETIGADSAVSFPVDI